MVLTDEDVIVSKHNQSSLLCSLLALSYIILCLFCSMKRFMLHAKEITFKVLNENCHWKKWRVITRSVIFIYFYSKYHKVNILFTFNLSIL